MKRLLYIIGIALLASCKGEPTLPTQYTTVEAEANIYPDYRNVVIPANIAPLNFQVIDQEADDFVVELKPTNGESIIVGSGDEGIIVGSGDEGIIQIDTTAWRAMLMENKGKDITVSVYAHHNDGWVLNKPHTLTVAEEEIDAYLSYRLIEPGYELYRQLGLYQRNLTNWDEEPIYENNRTYDDENNHCINCHNYQNYSTENMLFHVRSNHGGTMIVKNGKAEKVQIKNENIISAGVYPSWHPKHRWIAFSTNQTGQTFHLYGKEKIEVIDGASDLLFYDADKNEVKHILRSKDYLETFPAWAPDGNTLYYCSAYVPALTEIEDSMASAYITSRYDSTYYNLMSVSFDEKTQSFGTPQMVIDAASVHKSISVPRVSPDGRYLLYTQGDYGQFHIWHKSSDLWIKDLQNDSTYALTEANSDDVDSYHTWSSNGRWIVFSSRRMDGNYTRPHIAYFDKNGHAHKAFCLPQEDPRHNVLLLKSYNVPELTKDAVRTTPESLKKAIYETEGNLATYKDNGKVPTNTKESTKDADATTGASPVKQ